MELHKKYPEPVSVNFKRNTNKERENSYFMTIPVDILCSCQHLLIVVVVVILKIVNRQLEMDIR